MKNYWNCTPFADWLRGTPKPPAATSQGWSEWYKQAQKAHPFRYWLVEDALSDLQGIVSWPGDKINDVRYYINNRWVSRSHSLTAHPRDIKPGSWCDVGNRFLPCLFNELVDFVEVETAWHHVLWNEEARKKYSVPWWRRNFLRLRTWRSPEAGIEHLEWAASLTYVNSKTGKEEPTGQARGAKEILDLYYWWTQDYPNRPNVYDASGWSDYCERKRKEDPDEIMPEDKTPQERKTTRQMLNTIRRMEEKYHKEDEAMMIRLIKIRESLWT